MCNHLIIKRRGRDSNPRSRKAGHLISSQARSTTPAPLRLICPNLAKHHQFNYQYELFFP